MYRNGDVEKNWHHLISLCRIWIIVLCGDGS
jgi:hypothetical protein